MLTISSNGILFITQEEGKRNKAYKDAGGYWTIGVGHKIKQGEESLISKTLTDDEVSNLLRSDLSEVITAINNRIKVPISQNMIDSLASFLFNAGTSAGKDLFNLINTGAPSEAVYNQWVSHYITSNGIKIQNLVDRRKREASKATGISTGSTSDYLLPALGIFALSMFFYHQSIEHKKSR